MQWENVCFVKRERGLSRQRTGDCYASLVLHKRLTEVELTRGGWFPVLWDVKAVLLDSSPLASFVL